MLDVRLRSNSEPPFMTEDFSKKDIWRLCDDMMRSAQARLEKKLGAQHVSLEQLLQDIPGSFRDVFIEALKITDEGGGSNKNHNHAANELQHIVVFSLKDFVLGEDYRTVFMDALFNVVINGRGSNQKLNALGILAKWINNFLRKDLKLSSSRELMQKWQQIMTQFDINDDFKTLGFKMIHKKLQRSWELTFGEKINRKRHKDKPYIKRDDWIFKADYIHDKCLGLFSNLCAGDLANCKDKVRRTKDSVRALTKFFNTTSVAVALDILDSDNTNTRGARIDQWIKISDWLLNKALDYHSAAGVVSGLGLSSIYRLKKSWEYTKNGKTLEIVKDMLYNKNYADQRTALRKSFDEDSEAYKKMVIPLFAVITKDLEKLDNMPNTRDDGSLNKRKYQLVSKWVSDIIAQIDFDRSETFINQDVYGEMDKLYEKAGMITPNSQSWEDLEERADEYVKIEKGKVLCNQGVRSKLISSTLLNFLTWLCICYMLYVYTDEEKRAYMFFWVFIFSVGNMLSCYVTYITKFDIKEDWFYLQRKSKLNDMSFQSSQEQQNDQEKCCNCARIVAYNFDLVGLGVLPAFWRASKEKMMYENIYGSLSSSKKEFSRQIAVSSLGLHLPMVVYFFYTRCRSYQISLIKQFLVLIIPLISISYSIFHMFRGAHETIFLVSGRRIVVAGFFSLATDFLLRVFPILGLVSYLMRISSCDDHYKQCFELEFEHGEGFCLNNEDFLFPNNENVTNACCECGGGEIPSDRDSLMLKGLAILIIFAVVFYEFCWVFLFHRWEDQRSEAEEGTVVINPNQQTANWKKLLIKIGQSIGLSVTFLMVNIPFLGMHRSKYQRAEHYTRLLISIACAVVYIMFDTFFKDMTLVISFCIIIPICHIFAYTQFQQAFDKHDESMPDQSTMNRYGSSRFFRTFNTLFNLEGNNQVERESCIV